MEEDFIVAEFGDEVRVDMSIQCLGPMPKRFLLGSSTCVQQCPVDNWAELALTFSH